MPSHHYRQKIIQNLENELIDLICNDLELHSSILEALNQGIETSHFY